MAGIILLKSILAGFVVAVPVGAVGAICMRRGLQGRLLSGMATGLGAAVADTLLAAVAIFGLSLVSAYLFQNQFWLRALGSAALILFGAFMAWQPLNTNSQSRAKLKQQQKISSLEDITGLLANFAAGFGLTIINPATFMAFVGVLAGLELFVSQEPTWGEASAAVFGIFMGSLLWWTFLTCGSAAVHKYASDQTVYRVNRVVGGIMIALGAASLLYLFIKQG